MMTREEVIRLAKEAGIGTAFYGVNNEPLVEEIWGGSMMTNELIRFAQLVAAEYKRDADKYVWLIAHIGRINTMALDWDSSVHPPLLVWLHQYICKEAEKEGQEWITKQRELLNRARSKK